MERGRRRMPLWERRVSQEGLSLEKRKEDTSTLRKGRKEESIDLSPAMGIFPLPHLPLFSLGE